MEEVATRAGCSRAFLSRIERNESMPSVPTLVSIAHALEVSPGYFFADSEADKTVVLRGADRTRIENRGVVAELLTRDVPTRRLLLTRISLPKGQHCAVKRTKYDDDQCGLCLKGRVGLTADGTTHELECDDSFYLHGPTPYRIDNKGPGEAMVILVSSRRGL